MSEEKTKSKNSLEVIPNNMVSLTSEAAEKMKTALRRYSASGVRIHATQNKRGGVSFSLDVEEEARSDDLVLEDKGVKLFVDPSSTQHIQGIEIRYLKTERGSGFGIVNPASG